MIFAISVSEGRSKVRINESVAASRVLADFNELRALFSVLYNSSHKKSNYYSNVGFLPYLLNNSVFLGPNH
jgi:hypothetical protein